MTLAGARLGMISPFIAQTACAARASQYDGELSALDSATTWLNSQPLMEADLRGKVVLIDFCTYSCINWLRTLPYVRAWADKYTHQGLSLIGVHTPEFAFEKDVSNVRQAVKDLAVSYPLAIDNDYAIWTAFENQYWPALYFIDATGRIRHRYFGEGEYEQSERVIQRLLVEAGRQGVSRDLVSVQGRDAEAPADWGSLKSPEMYVGYRRSNNFASPGGVAPDEPRPYSVAAQLRLNQWALSGNWTIGASVISLNAPNGVIACRFHARDVHLVMGPGEKSKSLAFRVRIDGRLPEDARGSDVDPEGRGILSAQRMYQLIRQPGPVKERQFEIEFMDAGAEAFAFTFG
jgi:hypothetical protein